MSMLKYLGLVSLLGFALAQPMGWNSYDSFNWFIDEDTFLEQCQAVADTLLPHGYDHCVLDYLWYQSDVLQIDDPLDFGAWTLDQNCLPYPDPKRWPSAADGSGLKAIADKVHAMGLKFGLHTMRGTSIFAVEKDCVLLGDNPENYRISDIAITGEAGECIWKPQSLAVNVSHPGSDLFFGALAQQYSQWGVDFLKNDCVFGIHDFIPDNIHSLAKSIQRLPKPITYSSSPGATTDIDQEVLNAEIIASDVNMYRITGDDWDDWGDIDPDHFDAAAAMSSLIAVEGLGGKESFPDLDMLPLGRVSIPGDDDKSRTPFRASNLTQAEQKTLMTLWSIARSPLMFGGDATDLNDDNATMELLTHPEILTINQRTKDNSEVYRDEDTRIWSAKGKGVEALYLAIFNTAEEARTVTYNFDGFDKCKIEDVWANEDLGWVINLISVEVESHGAVALKLTLCN